MATVSHIRARWFNPAVAVVALVAALVLPILFGAGDYTLLQFEAILALLVVGLGLNIAMGMAGQFALGIIAVFAVSGFVVAWAVTQVGSAMSLPVMCILGAVAGAVTGLVLALPSLRVGQFYLALVTLYGAVVVPSVAQHWDALGGEAGLTLFTVPDFAPALEGFPLYAVMVVIVAVLVGFSALLKNSVVGHRFAALAASEQLSSSLGISGYRNKVLACTIGAAVAGVAGGLYVYSQQFFGHTIGGADDAILLLAALMIGGFGTLTGVVVGIVLVFGFNQFVTGLEQYTGVIFGLFLLLFTLFLPNGLVDRIRPLGRRLGLVVEGGPSAADRVEAGHATAADDLPPLVAQPNIDQLEVIGAARAFGGVRAVDGVDLVVWPGEIHGLIGSNGSGKTTLLNLISGYYSLDAGQIRVGDRVLSGRSTDAIARTGLARTFQTPKLITNGTVLKNILPAAEQSVHVSGPESVFRVGRGRRAAREAGAIANAALQRLGIRHLAHEDAAALPHGTRRLVEIARAIALQPRFLLCDEPAAGLSPAEADVMVRALCSLAESGVGVLLIEHNVPMVLEIATQVTVMHQGKVLFQGTPEQLRSDEKVAGAFLGIDVEMGAVE
jgi:branched-chain amino acid transport system permease protein